MLAIKKLLSTGRNNKLIRRYTMSKISKKCLVAIVQLNSTAEKYDNYSVVEKYVEEASQKNAKMVFLPEACDYLAESERDSVNLAESISGNLVTLYRDLARKFNIWISFGGLHIQDENPLKINNTHLIVDDKGNIASKYEKVHLFNYEKMPHKLRESLYVNSGETFAPVVDTPCGRLSMAVCYDLRFPEMSILQRRAGAEILTYPSAFTQSTGEAHWHVLLRARAIETQCYVVAAAQEGTHNPKRTSYGHSCIVDPWGKIIAELKSTGITLANIDLNYLKQIRSQMPVMDHRQDQIYSLHTLKRHENSLNIELHPPPSKYCLYKFGDVTVPGSCIVFKTFSSFVCVNKKPVSSNHLLAISDRPAACLKDLSVSEVCDIAQSVLLTFKLLKFVKDPLDIDIAIQDGPHAGQTIKHFHVHVLPTGLVQILMKQGHEHSDQPWRKESEMVSEAVCLRNISSDLFSKIFDNVLAEFPRPIELQEKEENISLIKGKPAPYIRPLLKTVRFVAAPAPNPILVGHTLIFNSTDTTSACSDITAGEISELFQCLQLTEQFLMEKFNTSSVTIYANITAKTDTKDLIFHIIPRQEGDLNENDQIYDLLKRYKVTHSDYLRWNYPKWANDFGQS